MATRRSASRAPPPRLRTDRCRGSLLGPAASWAPPSRRRTGRYRGSIQPRSWWRSVRARPPSPSAAVRRAGDAEIARPEAATESDDVEASPPAPNEGESAETTLAAPRPARRASADGAGVEDERASRDAERSSRGEDIAHEADEPVDPETGTSPSVPPSRALAQPSLPVQSEKPPADEAGPAYDAVLGATGASPQYGLIGPDVRPHHRAGSEPDAHHQPLRHPGRRQELHPGKRHRDGLHAGGGREPSSASACRGHLPLQRHARLPAGVHLDGGAQCRRGGSEPLARRLRRVAAGAR